MTFLDRLLCANEKLNNDCRVLLFKVTCNKNLIFTAEEDFVFKISLFVDIENLITLLTGLLFVR